MHLFKAFAQLFKKRPAFKAYSPPPCKHSSTEDFYYDVPKERILMIPDFIKALSTDKAREARGLYMHTGNAVQVDAVLKYIVKCTDYSPPKQFVCSHDALVYGEVLKGLCESVKGNLIPEDAIWVLRDYHKKPFNFAALRQCIRSSYRGSEYKVVLLADLIPHICEMMADRSLSVIAVMWHEALIRTPTPGGGAFSSYDEVVRFRIDSVELLFDTFFDIFDDIERYREIAELEKQPSDETLAADEQSPPGVLVEKSVTEIPQPEEVDYVKPRRLRIVKKVKKVIAKVAARIARIRRHEQA